MKRPAILYALAALIFIAHTAAAIAGWEDHTSVIAGMPRAEISWVVGPLFVVLHLATAVVVPVLLIAGTIDTMWWLALSERRSARRDATVLLERDRRPDMTRPAASGHVDEGLRA